MQDSLQSSSYKQLEQKSKYTNIFLRWFLYFVLILFASYFCSFFQPNPPEYGPRMVKIYASKIMIKCPQKI